jgi:hypothetical protein
VGLKVSGKVQLDGSVQTGHRWSDRRMSLLPVCRQQGRGGCWPPPFADDQVFEDQPEGAPQIIPEFVSRVTWPRRMPAGIVLYIERGYSESAALVVTQ